jgi:hypothetical protein
MTETKSSLTIRIDARLREQMEQVRREIVPAESQTAFIERAIAERCKVVAAVVGHYQQVPDGGVPQPYRFAK